MTGYQAAGFGNGVLRPDRRILWVRPLKRDIKAGTGPWAARPGTAHSGPAGGAEPGSAVRLGGRLRMESRSAAQQLGAGAGPGDQYLFFQLDPFGTTLGTDVGLHADRHARLAGRPGAHSSRPSP
jgi:hypothetical protein